jgi:hypothetical protein
VMVEGLDEANVAMYVSDLLEQAMADIPGSTPKA